MAIKYREDPGLKFLALCENDDVSNLAQILIYDTDGEMRRTSRILTDEGFTKNLDLPDKWLKSWQVIAGELQLYGGDSVVNFFRGNGVQYEEILSDVCDRVGVKLTVQESDVVQKEEKLIEFLAEKAWEKMSEPEREEFLKKINMTDRFKGGDSLSPVSLALAVGGAAAMLLYEYVAGAMLASLGAGLAARFAGPIAAQFVGTRLGAAALAGPFAVVLGVVLTIPVLSGAAYRVTMPAVIQIAYMRKKYLLKDVF
ncbi:DUF3944 domain-containing protein [Delftia sp. PS-11]|uniref:DUF3944 domain-containing protein n=1 Tax=Delftia sp. PS-11 TaxID=2767222 RepID=UPI002460DC5F|nr:DUF3944 domain-containing protein [Delftia sp. PS-11]